ncbi:hypothetical protein PRIEUP_LOCUS446 [Pristimantis euphronides]
MTRNQRHTVGIFSRDVEDNYKWLINLLRTRLFQSVVEVVLPVCISNTGRSFVTGLDESSFAILYHTKKRGRLNIASVTDSLYDEELEDLSRRLGRSNVIVLVDDLEDISDNMRRMLQEQGLDMYVCEVILVSGREKELSNLSGPDTRLSQSPITASMQDVCSSLHEKLVNLKGIMEHAPHHNTGIGLDISTADTSTADTSTADTSTADTSIADTHIADTSTAHTSTADTHIADTSTAHTSTADTHIADTSIADRSIADTSIADTSMADTTDTQYQSLSSVF